MSVSTFPSLASPDASAAISAEGRPALPGILQSPAERKAFRQAWCARVAALAAQTPRSGPSAIDMALYCLMLGKPLIRAFSPVTNARKLANGAHAYGYKVFAVASLRNSYVRERAMERLDAAIPPAAHRRLPDGFRFQPRYDTAVAEAARLASS